MKTKMSKIIEMITANKVKAVAISAAAVVTVTGAVAGAYAIAKNQGGVPVAPESSESEVSKVVSSEVSESETVEVEEVVSTTSELVSSEVVFDTSSEDPPPASEPTVSKNETVNSAPTPTTSSRDAGSSSSTDYTAPSDAFLDYCGMTLEEHQAAVEEASTCPLCGQKTGGRHHLYGRDMDCYDCGNPCKANTCHVCEEE